jgi:hypothetical protein
VNAEFFYTDGRTDRQKDMTKLMVTFANFANAPKKKKPENFNPQLKFCSHISAHNNSSAAVGKQLNESSGSHLKTVIRNNYFYGFLWDDGQT